VYLQSFADSDGDGVGDLAGLLERLDYIRDLGVDAIWITPWYPSPFNDGGYDIADYLDIDPHYGTLADARRLIEAAHDAEIKVIIDLVPNHTSTEHHWFVEALADGPGSAARDRYLFRPGRGPDGSLPPSDWQSIFGGSAWTQVADGEWYLHLFHNSQADINWENDAVREAFDGVLRYWLDLGVDGFRVDVAHGMIKGEPATDLGSVPELHTPIHRLPDHLDHPAWDRDGVHDLARRWRSVLDEYGDRLMVAEAVVHPTRLARYLRSDEYHQSFNFDLLEADWDAETFRSIIESSLQTLEEVDALPTWVVSNHDVVRPATRYGLPLGTDWYRWSIQGPREALDENLGARRARAIALITLGLPGAVYIYQGEELGLPEAWDLPPEVLRDPTWEQSGHTLKGRDGSVDLHQPRHQRHVRHQPGGGNAVVDIVAGEFEPGDRLAEAGDRAPRGASRRRPHFLAGSVGEHAAGDAGQQDHEVGKGGHGTAPPGDGREPLIGQRAAAGNHPGAS
jgi:alpha-glucosidase